MPLNIRRPRGKHAAAAVALATCCIAGYEGYSAWAYRDGGGVPTICFGETLNVHMGDHKTRAECTDLLKRRVREFDAKLVACIPDLTDAPAETRAALVSWSYNVGTAAACRSTLARYARAGEWQRACSELQKWHYDNGRSVRGLIMRREKEQAMCLEGLQ